MANYEEANSKMFWGSKRRRTLSHIGSLPEDLVFEILLRLPAEDIYETAVLVCKKWYNAIHSRNFVCKHLQHSTPGLLVHLIDNHDSPQPINKRFLLPGRGSVEVSKFSYGTVGRVWGSCNGLILECVETEDHYNLSIVNPVKCEIFGLPSIYLQPGIAYDPMIAYAEASNQYKVVVMGFYIFEPSGIESCVILTVGVDKSWRRVDIKHLDIDRCLSTQGFIHWTRSDRTCVANLNVETEIITEKPVPRGYEKRFRYLSMGSCLTLLVECGEFSWEVLKMKPETGEWTKMPKIDLEPLKGKFVNLVWEDVSPIGWLNEKVLALEFESVANLNVETEIITEKPVPRGYEKRFRYLSMGSCLTLLVECGEFSWEVLKMKPETGEWTKMPKIDLEPLKGKFVNLVWEDVSPIGWLNEKVLALEVFLSPVCVFYNVRTQEIESLELELNSHEYLFNVHKNSLV